MLIYIRGVEICEDIKYEKVCICLMLYGLS